MAEQEELVSPKKIRKLDVSTDKRKSRQKLFSLDSQDSRATSTPTPSRKKEGRTFSISTDISSIAGPSSRESQNSAESLHCASHINTSSEETIVSKLEDLTVREGDTSLLLQSSRKKFFKGKTWNFLKPKFEGTLYYKVLHDFDTIEDVAFQLLNRFRTDERECTLEMIKFLIDLCGYQSVEIDKYLDFEQNFSHSCEKLIKLLEFEFVDSEILENNTYIFLEASRGKSKMGATLSAAVNKYLEEFFCRAHIMKLLFAEFIHAHIFVFIFQMCQSTLRSIRHTGVVLTRSILRILNSIFMEETLNEQEEKYIKKYFQYFFLIFRKNSLIPDVLLSVLKSENVKCMGVWMVQLPEIYFDNCFEVLRLLILDQCGEVRLGVLRVFGDLIQTKSGFVTRKIPVVRDLIRSRMKDINPQVGVTSIKLYASLLDNYHEFISKNDIYSVGEFLFSKNYLYAKAAASFLVKFFKVIKVDEDFQLKCSIKINMTTAVVKTKPLFIEALSEFETIFKNYDFLFENLAIFSQEEETSDHANCLAELIYHSIYQELNGRCSIKRENSIKYNLGHAEKIKTSRAVLKCLERFFEKFHNQIHILNYFVNTFLLIDYGALSSLYATRHINYALKHCQTIFFQLNDKELLKNICHLFGYLNDIENLTPKETVQDFLNAFFQEMSDRLKNHYQMNDTLSQKNLRKDFNKIGILFGEFNLDKYFDWTLLYTKAGGLLHCEGQIVACQQFILWGIKDLIQLSKDGNLISMESIFLKTIYSEFTLSLIKVLTSKNSNQYLKIEAFQSLCTIHTSSEEILLKEETHALQEFRFFILENLQTTLCDEIIKYFEAIIKNKNVSIEKRRVCVTVWLSMVLNGVLDVYYLIHLLKNYHKYSEEYGNLIEFAAKNIFETKPQTFFTIILTTLVQSAEEELKTKKRDISEAIDLLMLAEAFAKLPQYSNSSKSVLQMIQLGLKFVFKEAIYGFLVVLQIFLQKLNKEDIDKCKQLFRNMTPKSLENRREVEYFRLKLSPPKSSGPNSTSTNSTMKSRKATPRKQLKKKPKAKQ